MTTDNSGYRRVRWNKDTGPYNAVECDDGRFFWCVSTPGWYHLYYTWADPEATTTWGKWPTPFPTLKLAMAQAMMLARVSTEEPNGAH